MLTIEVYFTKSEKKALLIDHYWQIKINDFGLKKNSIFRIME